MPKIELMKNENEHEQDHGNEYTMSVFFIRWSRTTIIHAAFNTKRKEGSCNGIAYSHLAALFAVYYFLSAADELFLVQS